MTVAELIAKLRMFPQDAPVVRWIEDGPTFVTLSKHWPSKVRTMKKAAEGVEGEYVQERDFDWIPTVGEPLTVVLIEGP